MLKDMDFHMAPRHALGLSQTFSAGIGSILNRQVDRMTAEEDKKYERDRQAVLDDRAARDDKIKQDARNNTLIAQNTATEDNFNAFKLSDHYKQGGAGDKALLAFIAKNNGGEISATDALRIYNEAEQTSGVSGTTGPLLSKPTVQNQRTGSVGQTPVYKTITTASNVNPADVIHTPGSSLLFKPESTITVPQKLTNKPTIVGDTGLGFSTTIPQGSYTPPEKPGFKLFDTSKQSSFIPAGNQNYRTGVNNLVPNKVIDDANGKLTQAEYAKLSPKEQRAYLSGVTNLLPAGKSKESISGFLASLNPATKKELVKAGISSSSKASVEASGYTIPVDSGIVNRVYKDVYNNIPKDEKQDVQRYANLLGQVVGRGGIDGGGSTAQEVGLSEIIKNSIGTGEASDKDKALFELSKAKAGDTLKQYNEDTKNSLERYKIGVEHSDRLANINATLRAAKTNDPTAQAFLMNMPKAEFESLMAPVNALRAQMDGALKEAKYDTTNVDYLKLKQQYLQAAANLGTTQVSQLIAKAQQK